LVTQPEQLCPLAEGRLVTLTALRLSAFAAGFIEGIYGPEKSALPDRMRFLLPEAIASVEALTAAGHRLRASDVYRSGEKSREAVRSNKAGVQRAAYSAHNYGLAMDVDTGEVMKRWKLDKKALDDLMDAHGWVCHRMDHDPGALENWHYNFLDLPGTASGNRYRGLITKSSAPAVEQRIQDLYGAAFDLDGKAVQAALKKLGHFAGQIDGSLAGATRDALRAFQRDWDLDESGQADARTMRTLAFVALGSPGGA
jgi:hypothetical protein